MELALTYDMDHWKQRVIEEGFSPAFKPDGSWDYKSIRMPKTRRKARFPWGSMLLCAVDRLYWDGHDFSKTAPKPKRRKRGTVVKKCHFPDCSAHPSDPHHVTYKPVFVVPLCREHHKEITCININESEKTYGKLSNKHRWWAFGRWLKGELKPDWTPRALEWLSTWK